MNKQQILFAKDNNNYSRNAAYDVKLPKVITHISPFELQFGMKQPAQYRCRVGELTDTGGESVEIPGYTDKAVL